MEIGLQITEALPGPSYLFIFWELIDRRVKKLEGLVGVNGSHLDVCPNAEVGWEMGV